jgi:hypothetical protein
MRDAPSPVPIQVVAMGELIDLAAERARRRTAPGDQLAFVFGTEPA